MQSHMPRTSSAGPVEGFNAQWGTRLAVVLERREKQVCTMVARRLRLRTEVLPILRAMGALGYFRDAEPEFGMGSVR